MNRPILTQHYEQLIGLQSPWGVASVELSHADREVVIYLEIRGRPKLRCPKCGAVCGRYDGVERRWRHLDTMQYRTTLVARVPRVQCGEHGVVQVEVPWAEPGGRFTALFEALVIDWLQAANVSEVARQLGLTWDQAAGIMKRAVKRGLERRNKETPRGICVDETSFSREREYVTVVSTSDGTRVLYVGEDRRATTLAAYYKALGAEGCGRLEHVVMDMWDPYIKATKEHVPDAEDRIVFDKYHIAFYLNRAVDLVRRQENRELLGRGDRRLARTRHLWLYNPLNLSRSRWLSFSHLRNSRLKVARAWALKETAMSLWGYVRRGWAVRMWTQWLAWAKRSRLEPMKRVARTIERYFYGVRNAALTPLTNAGAESLNSRIQTVKRKARGFRNRDRFRDAIYFHFGALDLYPKGAKLAHSKP
jgi:transposase